MEMIDMIKDIGIRTWAMVVVISVALGIGIGTLIGTLAHIFGYDVYGMLIGFYTGLVVMLILPYCVPTRSTKPPLSGGD